MSIKSKEMTLDERLSRMAELLKQFKENEAFYMSKDFVESEVRSKFIDPFLECLKWDVKNEKGARPDKREVITEDRIAIEGQIKHPDYTLMFGGVRKIFIEAKQPSIDLKTNPEPALQVRRYAYTAKMPIAILTDFQELAIYDTRIKPSEKDCAATARIEYLTYEQYEEKFEELYHHISWDAVDLGSFDSYYEGLKEKRGTATVDEDILEMIERWRVLLAEDIALHNEEMNETVLTSCVQKLIDRVLFLRIAEDKEIEPVKQLYKIAEQKESIYSALKSLFLEADGRFNAGLFKNDEALNSLQILDKTLITIITELYYPASQYEFSVLPVEILGSIYERFLGKVIRFKRKTKNGHSIEVIEKPEVQKAGGVYYTPSYIVNYIVRQTIGKKIEGLTPEKVSSLKVCDPSCGSGSFLVGAYQYLLNWHFDYYYNEERRNKSEKKGLIYKDARNHEYKLSIEEKRRILLNNIYGVDIDGQAVEVTKLSLFLKLLENEGKALSKDGQASLFKTSDIKKILPELKGNIKCGNSLIGSDYYNEKDISLLEITEQKRVNVFDWESEFENIFKAGGFDCVIGNPPYVKEYTNKECFNGLYKHPCYQGKMDLWYFFGVLGIKLIKKDGLVGLIAPNNWITNTGASLFRNFILENAKILEYVDFGNYKVFETASIQTMIYIIKKTQKNEKYLVKYSRLNNENVKIQEVLDFLANHKNKDFIQFKAEIIKKDCINNYILFLNNKITNVLNHIKEKSNARFEKHEVIQGIVGAPDECFIVSDTSYFTDKEKAFIKPYYTGILDRYRCKKTDKYIIYLSNKNFMGYRLSNYPNFEKHFANFKQVLKEAKIKYKTPKKPYYYLHRERDEDFFKEGTEKIISQGRTIFPRFYYTKEAFYPSRALFVIKTDRFNLKSLTAILNSLLIKFWLKHKGKMQGDNFQVDKEPLLELPLIHTSENQNKELERLVDDMLDTLKKLELAKFENDKKFLAQRTEILDKQINASVYALYGLTDEEIKIVEG
ncbi:MAG: Eco57I restriction-modification methylase domain-containing protein [Treponema sp.]